MPWLNPAGGYRFGSILWSSMTRLMAARVSSSSKITKLEAMPMRSASRRSTRTAVAWNVPTHIFLAPSPTSASTRDRISRAALLVNVTASSRSGHTRLVAMRWAMRTVSTRVLPLPAPAKIRSGPSPCVTASCWGSLRPARRDSTLGATEPSVDTLDRRVYRPPSLPKGRREIAPAPLKSQRTMAREIDFKVRDHLLYELARDMSSSLELDIVLRNVMDRVINLMKASRGFIVLVDPTTRALSVQVSGGDADPKKSREFLGSRSVIERVVRTG